MIRGTTPTFTFTIRSENVDLNEARNVYVTITQSTKAITKDSSELAVNGRTVSFRLTQEESMKLTEGNHADVQLNWTYLDADGVTIHRAATKVISILIDRQLLRRVIE